MLKCLKCLSAIANEEIHYGLHEECFTDWFQSQPNAEFLSLIRRSESISDANKSPQNNSFFQGRFKKYSAELEGVSYILKMRETDAPELPEVEYLCNQIALLLRIHVAEFFMIDFFGDRVFVTKNFIGVSSSPIDLQHIYHFRKDEQHTCEDLINVIARHTQKPYDVNKFIKSTLFDALIGNNDRHGKNIGLIVTFKDTTLSPSYDNVSYLSLEQGEMLKADFNPTGKVSTKDTNEPSMKDYVREFKRLRYTKLIEDFYKEIEMTKIETLIDNSFCSELMKNALKKLITKRFKELDNELKA